MLRRTWTDSLTTSKPFTVAVPAVGVSSVVSIRRVVVLPAPLGPRKDDDLALRDVEVDALDRLHVDLLPALPGVERLDQSACGDHRRSSSLRDLSAWARRATSPS